MINIVSACGRKLIINFSAYKIVSHNIREVVPVVNKEIAEVLFNS